MMSSSITSDQKRQYRRFVEDAGEQALAEVDLNKDRFQKFIERGDEFQDHIIAGIRELSVSNQFVDEDVKSSYGYLSGYEPKPIVDQVNVLRELFPELGSVDEMLANRNLPLNAEGWFAILRWEKIASTYGEAVQKVLDLIKQTRDHKFYNYRHGKLGPKYLRQHEHTTVMLKRLGDVQSDHDILMVPAQFGFRYRGKSVRRSREMFNAFEFGLGSFQVACMILTHPERIQHLDDLWIDCAGDEFAPCTDRGFSSSTCFNFSHGHLGFGAGWIGHPVGYCGSVSGFVPKF